MRLIPLHLFKDCFTLLFKQRQEWLPSVFSNVRTSSALCVKMYLSCATSRAKKRRPFRERESDPFVRSPVGRSVCLVGKTESQDGLVHWTKMLSSNFAYVERTVKIKAMTLIFSKIRTNTNSVSAFFLVWLTNIRLKHDYRLFNCILPTKISETWYSRMKFRFPNGQT